MRRCCRPCPAPVQTVCYCSRYWDLPMNIYYGPGYTAEDSLITMQEDLARISRTLTCICRKLG